MSVLLANRKESKFEGITHAVELRNMLAELTGRDFGVKDIRQFVRRRYASGKGDAEDFRRYRFLMDNAKCRIDNLAARVANNVRAANSIYPTSMREYERRRRYQTEAVVCCEQIVGELQRVVETFGVDVNLFARHIQAIDKEIRLIKKWRQRDNRIKTTLQGGI